MQHQPNYYAIIPANVRYSKELEPNAKLLYGEITALSHQEGYCWASNAYFAELYDVDERTVKRWLESLKNNNFIYVETYKNGMAWDRKIWISKEIFTMGQKCPDREDKNVRIEGTKMPPNQLNKIKVQEIDDTRAQDDEKNEKNEDAFFMKSKDPTKQLIRLEKAKLIRELEICGCTKHEAEEAIKRLIESNPTLLPGSVIKYLQKIVNSIRKEEIERPKQKQTLEKKNGTYQSYENKKSGIRQGGKFIEVESNKREKGNNGS